MQRCARRLQRSPAGIEVDRVVAVATVGRAPMRRHQPTVAKQAQVIRHQILRLADERDQLLHGPIALHQLAQQPPTDRMRRQPHERRRFTSLDGHRLNRSHETDFSEVGESNQMKLMELLAACRRLIVPGGWSRMRRCARCSTQWAVRPVWSGSPTRNTKACGSRSGPGPDWSTTERGVDVMTST